MTMRRVVPALLLIGVLTACGSGDEQPATTGEPTTSTSSSSTTTSTTEAPVACSAAVLSGSRTDDPGTLPDAVAEARAAVLEAALACDFERLEELSLAGDGAFTYSFGQTGPAGLADHLRAREAEGEEIVRVLVETLRLPYATSEEEYAWPSAHSAAATDRDWEALRDLYADEEIAAWQAPGSSGFLGYRVAFTADGDWQYFVAGD